MKMKPLFLSLCLISATLSPVAHAQGKKIVTINPDGSVTVTEPDGDVQKLPPPKLRQRRGPPFADSAPPAPPSEPAAEPQVQTMPVEKKETVAPRKPSAPKKQAAPARSAPEKPAIEKPAVTKPEKKAVKKPEKKKATPPKKPVAEEPVIKGEPAAPDSLGRVDPRYKPEPRRTGPVTPDDAKRIAIDVGPPARAVDVYPADYNGRKVFQVIFHTEDGERYILVDRASGDIVKD